MTDTKKPIAYIEHPCSVEAKEALNKKGFKVLDARLAPEKLAKGDKLVLKQKPKAKPKQEASEEVNS